MNTSVPRSIRTGAEVAEDDRVSARPPGRPLADWLDEVIADRPPAVAGDRGDRQADMEAIAAEMARFSDEAASRSGAGRDRSDDRPVGAARPSPQKTGIARFATEDAIRNAIAEIARRQAVLDRGGSAPPPSPEPRPQAATSAPVTGVAASDPHGSPPHDADAPSAPTNHEPSGLRRAGIDLGAEVAQTFERFSRDLHEAIHATDARPLVRDLDRQVHRIGRAVDGLGAGLPSGEALARIGEQTREVRDLLTAAAGRSPPFDGVERQVATLEARLGRLAALPQGAQPASDATLAEVRSLLDNFKPGAAISSLENRLDDLSSRIAQGLEGRDPAGLIEGLSRRVDEIHSSLQSRMAETAVDTRPLETLMRGIGERIGQAREASSDLVALESAMRDFTARLEALGPGADQSGVQAIEAQIARLGERLERSEGSLRSLDGVEQSLGELFSQFEVTRQVAIDAAETAARTAARDTLRAALQSPTLRPADAMPGLAEQVARGLDDLRSSQDQAERRTQAGLAEIRGTIERLAQQMNGASPASRGSDDKAAIPIEEPRGGRNRTPFAEAKTVAATEPAPRSSDPADLLIEPGFGRKAAGRTEPKFEAGLDATAEPQASPASAAAPSPAVAATEGDGPASFIAAARRAAQAAQASAASATATKAAERRSAPRTGPAAEAGPLGRARSYLERRRRPILLGLAALVLLVSALEVVKLNLGGSSRVGAATAVSSDADRTRIAAIDSEAAPRAVVPAPQAAPAAVAAAPVVAPPAPSPARPPLPSFVAGLSKPQGAPADGLGEGLRSLAASGDAAAEYEVGLRLADGRGVARDPKQALSWFDKAAQQGLAPAEYRLGSMYEKGIGADRDPALAMAWYGKAADAGNIRAMHNLAVMAAEGAVGKPDYAKAAQWFQKASAYGVRDSQFNLAILYARGLGIEQSLAQSYTWFAIAAAQGDDDAAKKRDEVAQKLDPKVLATAKAAVDAYRATPQIPAANDVAAPAGGWDAVAPHAAAGDAKVSRL